MPGLGCITSIEIKCQLKLKFNWGLCNPVHEYYNFTAETMNLKYQGLLRFYN